MPFNPQNNLANFGDIAESVVEALEFRDVAFEMRRHVTYFYTLPKHERPSSEFLKSYLQLSEPRDAIVRGLMLEVCSGFEAFLRSMLVSGLAYQSSRHRRFDQFPAELRERYISVSGAFLARRLRAEPRDVDVDWVTVARALGEFVPGGETVELVAEVYKGVIDTFGATAIDSVFKHLGVAFDGEEELWDEVGRHQKTQEHFDEKGVRRAGKHAAERLGEIVRQRNQLTHRLANFPAVTPSDVQSAATFLELLARALSDVLVRELK